MIIFFSLVVLQVVFSKKSMHIMLLTITTEEAYDETSAHIANVSDAFWLLVSNSWIGLFLQF